MSDLPPLPRLALTPGEPGGVGPELLIRLAQVPRSDGVLIAVADPDWLRKVAAHLGLPLRLKCVEGAANLPSRPAGAGELYVWPVAGAQGARWGVANPAHAGYVLECLRVAAAGCLVGHFAGLVTGPVQKSSINAAGIPFSGHTEFLAAHAGDVPVVMMLASGNLRVALTTTHLPLRAVPDAITPTLLRTVLRILDHDLRDRFGIERPRICVLGLNPHAGEDGHLGREEIEILHPVLEALRGEGLMLEGPVPADTAFARPPRPGERDAYLAMYHDQGLPPLKQASFGGGVNITLGLPYIRTSVDHGTALDVAGRGVADAGSLQAALDLAVQLAHRPLKDTA